WYLNRLEPDSTAYHLGLCLRLTGDLDEAALAEAWEDIGAAHLQLRARFIFREERPSVKVDFCPASLRVASAGADGLDRFWKEIARRPFRLDAESPVRALLVDA